MPTPHFRIDVLRDFSRADHKMLDDFLVEQFDRIEGEHPATQVTTDSESKRILASPETFAVVCRNEKNELVGATIVTTDLSAVNWVSERFFRSRFNLDTGGYSQQGDGTPLFFITSMAVVQTAPSQVLNGMIDRLTDIVADADGVAVADLADRGRSHSLAKHIAGRVATRYESDWQALGTQTYHAFRPGKPVKKIPWSEARRLVAEGPSGAVRD